MKKSTLITVAMVAVMLVSVSGFAIANSTDTIKYLQEEHKVCSDCHTDVKKGHMEKKECDRCHEPGEKKEVHSMAPVSWDVNNPDEWKVKCQSCHTWNKAGHQEQKKECLSCHGSGAKHDVHTEHEEKNVDIGCSTCHGDPTIGPKEHLDNCDACHGYM